MRKIMEIRCRTDKCGRVVRMLGQDTGLHALWDVSNTMAMKRLEFPGHRPKHLDSR